MKRPSSCLPVLLCAMLSVATACGEVTRLERAVRQKLEQGRPVKSFATTGEIPAAVMAACNEFIPGHQFRLAQPGQRFQVTDAIGPDERDLPSRRLVWAVELPGFVVIHYEAGGFAHTFHVLVVATGEEKGGRVIWSPFSRVLLKDYAAFVRALKEEALDDRQDYRR